MSLTTTNKITKCPKVSVGLPVYNGEKTLSRALNHILNQIFSDYELLISDNASNDKTEEICKKYQQKYSSIKYFRRDHNYGISNNFKHIDKVAIKKAGKIESLNVSVAAGIILEKLTNQQ